MKNNAKKESGSASLIFWVALFICVTIVGYFGFKNYNAADKQPHNSSSVNTPEHTISNTKDASETNNTDISTYIKPEYADQILFVTELKILLIKGENFSYVLDQISTLVITDEKIKAAIENLRSTGKVQSMDALVTQYEHLRNDIIKVMYSDKYSKIPLLKWILNVITIQSRGDRAIRLGPPESTLEIASQHLSKDNLLEAHKAISALDDKYKSYTKGWLEEVQKYLTVQSTIQDILEHITSAEYKSKFTKKCSCIDKG